MRAREFQRAIKTFVVRIRLPQRTNNIFQTTIQARNAEQARRLIRALYGDSRVLIGQPKEIKTNK